MRASPQFSQLERRNQLSFSAERAENDSDRLRLPENASTFARRPSSAAFRRNDPGQVTRFAASSVFCSSIAMVMGPTPPGTGVMAAATAAAAS